MIAVQMLSAAPTCPFLSDACGAEPPCEEFPCPQLFCAAAGLFVFTVREWDEAQFPPAPPLITGGYDLCLGYSCGSDRIRAIPLLVRDLQSMLQTFRI